jgi:hypothetical protein
MSSMSLAPTFRPTAAETPGGGRIRDKHDPAPGDLVTVRGVNGPVQLHRLAAQAWAALADAARAAGLREPLLLPVSGYRSSARQARLYQSALCRYGTPELARRWVAPPGSSAHQSGRAIDFYLGGRNASSNVAALRRTPAYLWLAGHAEIFGFYPYQAEPWHWEYNPPASQAAPGAMPEPMAAGPPASGNGPGGIRAGRLEAPGVPVLASHRGQPPALLLRWNDMPGHPASVDIVVHLHGYSQGAATITGGIERYSGLDLAPVDGAAGQGRSRPTLTVLPRGDFSGAKNASGLAVATFPALDGTDGRRDGLDRLIQFSLEQFAARAAVAVPRAGRLILTAHSGGGLALLRLLRQHDPDEVHVFDALYWDPQALADWARRHIRKDRAALGAGGPDTARAYMTARGGALRVFYRSPTSRLSQQVQRAISPELGTGLADWYRVEASTLGHWDIPRTYGWKILAEASASVPATGPGAGLQREVAEEAQGVPARSAGEHAPPELPGAVPALLRSVRGVAEGIAAFAGGERDASRLTDAVFHARHPERAGRAIAPGETQAAQEWIWIRDHLVRSLLRATGTAPAAVPLAAPAAGPAGTTSAAPFLKQVREPDRYRLLAPMLDRYRGDIPLEFLLGWAAVESAGRIDEVTKPPLDERGFFQISRSESAALKLDHGRLTTDPDYSVQAGIQLIRHYAGLAQTRYPWAAPGSELFWRMVKLQHAMGSGLTRTLISSMQASHIPLTWEVIKRYEVSDGPRLHQLLNPRDAADRGRFTRNVDKVFLLGRQLTTALGR